MNTKKYFNASRFLKLMQNDILINYKNYLITFTGFAAIMYLILFFSMTNLHRIYDWAEYSANFTFGLIALAAFVGSSFPAFGNKITGNAYLLLPASILEKYLHQFIVRIVVGTFIFLALFWLTAQLARLAALNTEQVKQAGVFIEKFSFSMIWEKFNANNFKILSSIGFITLGIFLFSVRVYFRKLAALKSFLLAVVIVFIIVSYLVILSHFFFPRSTHGFTICWEFMSGLSLLFNMNIMGYLAISALWITILTLGYFKLKEKQA